MVLDKSALAFGVDESESVYTETLHVSERSRDGPVGKNPRLHSGRLGMERHEVPGIVVGGLGLGNLLVRFRFDGMDEVDELDGICLSAEYSDLFRVLTLDEEDGNVVSDYQVS